MRAMWKGSLGFGLVNIPVKMYVAVEESSLSFVQLDKKDHSRVRYKKVNENTGKELHEGDIVKAYPLGNDYVVVGEEDFQKAAPEKFDHLAISQFVNEREIDAVYYEKPYYLEPEKAGSKAYVLLRDALKKEGKAGLGTLVFHNKEWVCLIKAMKNVLVMHRLRYSDEIRSEKGVVIPDMPSKADELKMAGLLINQLSKPFDPENFRDTYSEKLLGVIEAKAKGKPTAKVLKVAHNATTIDLIETLKASLKVPGKAASKKAS